MSGALTSQPSGTNFSLLPHLSISEVSTVEPRAKSGHRGVSRIDSPAKKMHGWYVRVRFSKQSKAKFIPDKLYGGEGAALVRAVECRDEFERELGRPRTDHQVVGDSPRNPAGVVGVRPACGSLRGAGSTSP